MPILAAGLFALAGCSTAAMVAHKEDDLAAAGFIQRPANTAERQAMLGRLPAHQFVRRVRGDKVNYVYADPTNCDCLYVGDQRAYGRYQRHRQREDIASQNALAASE